MENTKFLGKLQLQLQSPFNLNDLSQKRSVSFVFLRILRSFPESFFKNISRLLLFPSSKGPNKIFVVLATAVSV